MGARGRHRWPVVPSVLARTADPGGGLCARSAPRPRRGATAEGSEARQRTDPAETSAGDGPSG
eukprot:168844-Chlamydomonas_euryale.AAC.1